jgi:hypothetical protein
MCSTVQLPRAGAAGVPCRHPQWACTQCSGTGSHPVHLSSHVPWAPCHEQQPCEEQHGRQLPCQGCRSRTAKHPQTKLSSGMHPAQCPQRKATLHLTWLAWKLARRSANQDGQGFSASPKVSAKLYLAIAVWQTPLPGTSVPIASAVMTSLLRQLKTGVRQEFTDLVMGAPDAASWLVTSTAQAPHPPLPQETLTLCV